MLSGLILASLLLAQTPARDPSPPTLSGTLIVLNKSDNTASLIDLASHAVRATVPTGEGPHEVAVSPDGEIAVVADYGHQHPGSTLTVIEVANAKVARTIDLGEPRRPHGIVYLDDERVLVTCEQTRSVLEVDVASGEIVQEVATDQDVSHMVVASPDATRAFVASIGSGSMTAVDLVDGSRLRTVPTGTGAEGIAITPDGREVWVTNRNADTLTVIDADSLETLAEVPCARFPIRAQVTADGRHVLVSCAMSGDVAVVDRKTRREWRRIPMAAAEVADDEGRLFAGLAEGSPVPVGLLLHPDGRHAFVANTQADVVTVLDLKEWKVAGRLTAGREPDGLAITPVACKTGQP